MAASVRVLKAACLLQKQKLVWNFKDSEGRYFGWVKETAEKGKETEHLDGSGCCESARMFRCLALNVFQRRINCFATTYCRISMEKSLILGLYVTFL